MSTFFLGFFLGGWASLIFYVILATCEDDKPDDREHRLP